MMLKIVVNGSFDIVHFGHLKLLEHARSYLDSFVYVLIDSDRRIRELKGNLRPINNQEERKFLLESLRYVDKVDIFDSDKELENFIAQYNPDVMVKGSDYRGKSIIGSKYCKDIDYYDRIEKFSTTAKIHSIVNRR